MKLGLVSFVSLTLTWAGAEAVASACGGLFCDSANVPLPPSQSSERVIFVVQPPGHDATPAALDEPATPDTELPAPDPERGAVDTYVEIAYRGAAADFAWIVPVRETPTVIGTAHSEIFDSLDAATAPQFTFTYAAGGADGRAPQACGDDCSSGGGEGGDYFDTDSLTPEVTVLGEGRVGPYEVAILESTRADELRTWLLFNQYRINAVAEPAMAEYVEEGAKFVAFRLGDDEGIGAIQPVVLRIPGDEPCIPLRLTRIASEPVLTVTAIVLGSGLVRLDNFSDALLDMQTIRPTSPSTTDYADRLRETVATLLGRAFQTELAGGTEEVPATDPHAAALLAEATFVTRLATRIAPDEMTLDPIFRVTADLTPVTREHIIDISDDPDALDAIGAIVPPLGGRAATSGDCGLAGPRPPLSALLLLSSSTLLIARRVRRRRRERTPR